MHLNYANNIAVVSEQIVNVPALWIFEKKTKHVYISTATGRIAHSDHKYSLLAENSDESLGESIDLKNILCF